jgi:hypothetical protein
VSPLHVDIAINVEILESVALHHTALPLRALQYSFTLTRSLYAAVAVGLSRSDIDADTYQLHFLQANRIVNNELNTLTSPVTALFELGAAPDVSLYHVTAAPVRDEVL